MKMQTGLFQKTVLFSLAVIIRTMIFLLDRNEDNVYKETNREKLLHDLERMSDKLLDMGHGTADTLKDNE